MLWRKASHQRQHHFAGGSVKHFDWLPQKAVARSFHSSFYGCPTALFSFFLPRVIEKEYSWKVVLFINFLFFVKRRTERNESVWEDNRLGHFTKRATATNKRKGKGKCLTALTDWKHTKAEKWKRFSFLGIAVKRAGFLPGADPIRNVVDQPPSTLSLHFPLGIYKGMVGPEGSRVEDLNFQPKPPVNTTRGWLSFLNPGTQPTSHGFGLRVNSTLNWYFTKNVPARRNSWLMKVQKRWHGKQTWAIVSKFPQQGKMTLNSRRAANSRTETKGIKFRMKFLLTKVNQRSSFQGCRLRESRDAFHSFSNYYFVVHSSGCFSGYQVSPRDRALQTFSTKTRTCLTILNPEIYETCSVLCLRKKTLQLEIAQKYFWFFCDLEQSEIQVILFITKALFHLQRAMWSWPLMSRCSAGRLRGEQHPSEGVASFEGQHLPVGGLGGGVYNTFMGMGR